MAGLFTATFALNVCFDLWLMGMIKSIAGVDASLFITTNIAMLNRSVADN